MTYITGMIPMLSKKDKKPNRSLESAISLGYQFLAATAVFVGIGYYIDQRRGGGSLFTIIGVGMTFVYGGYEVWKLVVLLEKEAEREEAERREQAMNPENRL